MPRRTVKVINRLGLHARAAAQLVRIAGQFESKVTLTKPDDSVCVNAKSILSILAMAASQGTILTLEVVGEDEVTAIAVIDDLFTSGFGESD